MTRADERAEWLYARVLALYPRRFREEYGEELRRLFRDLLADDTLPRWRLWLSVLADIPGSVIPEHLARFWEGNPMIRWAQWFGASRGLYPGLALGLVWAVYNGVNNALNLDKGGYAVLNNTLMVAVVCCFAVAGFLGARHAGTIRAGAVAGVSAAVISSLIGIVTLWLVTWLFFARIHENTAMIHDFHHSGATSMDAFIIEDALGATCFGTLIALALGALIGTASGGLAKLSLRLHTR